MEIRLGVEHGTEETSTWMLVCTNPLEYLLTDFHERAGLNVWDSHAVIDVYVQPHEGVYISKAAVSPEPVIGRLWEAHREAVGDWIAFDRFLNDLVPLRGLLTSSAALIATAPTVLASVYAEVLERAGCAPTRIISRPATVDAAKMAHFGESYVVAREITARRVPPETFG